MTAIRLQAAAIRLQAAAIRLQAAAIRLQAAAIQEMALVSRRPMRIVRQETSPAPASEHETSTQCNASISQWTRTKNQGFRASDTLSFVSRALASLTLACNSGSAFFHSSTNRAYSLAALSRSPFASYNSPSRLRLGPR